MEQRQAPFARARLLEVDPDLGSLLTRDERDEARQLSVPVVTVDRSDRNLAYFRYPDTFAALVLDGMVLRQIRVADQLGMRLFGPGDVVSLRDLQPPVPVAGASFTALADTRLALLGREFLLSARHWPALFSALDLRNTQQTDRLAAQLVICQLPRVDQRLMALMWLLAESWGRVTPSGTALRIRLTHEALGALIGARRPTVTLALRELAETGAIIRQDKGWLLLAPPPAPSEQLGPLNIPALVEDGRFSWAADGDSDVAADQARAAEEAARSAEFAQLSETLETLRERHRQNSGRFAERMERYATVRERCRTSRRQIESQRLSRRTQRSPSS